MKTTVTTLALRQVLTALDGEGHLIRELQATRGPLFDNPIDTLIAEYQAGRADDTHPAPAATDLSAAIEQAAQLASKALYGPKGREELVAAIRAIALQPSAVPQAVAQDDIDAPMGYKTPAEQRCYSRGYQSGRKKGREEAVAVPEWISVDGSLPAYETPVLILHRGGVRIGALRWDHPGYEDNYSSYRYWDDPNNDGQDWEWCYVTHWMPMPAAPVEAKGETA